MAANHEISVAGTDISRDCSMRVALSDLKLEQLDVIHAGDSTFPIAPKIRAVAARRILQDVQPLR